MAGIPLSQEQIDYRVGTVVIALRNAFRDIASVAAFMGRVDDPTLTGLGYDSDQIYLLRRAFEQLNTLRCVAYGQATVPALVDHFDPANKLTGLE